MVEHDVPLTRENYIAAEFGPDAGEIDEHMLPEAFQDASGLAQDAYDPNEARVGKGEPGGGQWTSAGGGIEGSAVYVPPIEKGVPPEDPMEAQRVTAHEFEDAELDDDTFTFAPQHVMPPTARAQWHTHVISSTNPPGMVAPAQLSWESQPGRTTHHMAGIENAPIEQRKAFHQAIRNVLVDANGTDRIAKAFGLQPWPAFDGPGVYQGETNPGTQSGVTPMLPFKLSPVEVERLNASEAVRGALLRQDAAAWHRPTFQFSASGTTPMLVPTIKWKGKLYSNGPNHGDALEMMPEDVRANYLDNGKNDDSTYGYMNEKGQFLDRRAARKYAEQEQLLKGTAFKQPDLISEDLIPEYAAPQLRMKPKDANLLDFRIEVHNQHTAGRALTDDEAIKLAAVLSKVGGGFFSPIATKDGFRLLNVPEASGLDNEAFKKQVVQALEADSDLPDLIMHAAKAETGYIENDWSKDPHGEGYRKAIAGSKRPDVARTADALFATLGPQIAAVEDDFARRYGWKPDEETRFWQNEGLKLQSA